MGKSFRQIPTPQEILGDEPKRKIPTPQEILGEDHPLVKKKETSGGGVINSSTGGQTVQGIQSWEATPEFEKRYNEAQPKGYEQINKAPQANTTAVAKPKVTKDVLADLDTKRRNNETGYAKEAISKGKTVAEMAAIFRAGQDPDFKKQYDALSITGLRQDVPIADLLQGKMGEEVRADPSLIFGEATQGDNIRNAFSNPQFIAELKKNPEVYSQFKNEMSNFLTHYPEAGKTYLGNILSQKMENMGINNGLMNVVSKSQLDKVVNKLKEEGELTPAEIDFVNKQIRPRMGLENLGRTIVGKPSIKTTGLVENALESAVKSGRDLGQGIAEVTGLRPLIQGEAGALSSDIEREKRQVQVKGANLWHDITQYGGQTLGQAAITGGVGRGLQALKLVKGAPAALALSGGMQAYGNYAPEARKMFPTNVAAQRGFSTIMAGIEAGTENIFRDDKVVKGLLGEMRGTVKKTINDFTQKNITAAAAKETIGNAFKQALQKVPEAAKLFAKAVGENTLEEVAAQVGQDITEGVFEGRPVEDLVSIDNIGNTARQAFLGSAFIGGLAARADMKKNRGISAKQIYLMARDPETWAEQIRKTNNSPEDASDLQDKLGNLEFASNLLKELDANTIMSEKQKTKFLLTALDSKIKSEQQPSNQITDPSIKAQADAKIREAVAENDKIKEDILSGKDDGTFEGDKTDEANGAETKLFEQIYKSAPEGYKATLEAAKSEGNVLGGLDYMKDKFAENPVKFREDFGDEITDKVEKQTPTETIMGKLDYLLENNADDPAVKVLDKILEGRAEGTTEGSVAIPSRFKGYVEDKGGLPDDKPGYNQDRKMRSIATGFIGEIKRDGSVSYKSAETVSKKTGAELNWDKESGNLSAVNNDSKVVMLARNYEYNGKPLSKETKDSIKKAADNGAEFVLSDMDGVDTQFIDYLQAIGAPFTIYHAEGNAYPLAKPEIKIQQDAKRIIEGKAVLNRLSPEEERGRAESGYKNVEATILLNELQRTNREGETYEQKQKQAIVDHFNKKGEWSGDIETGKGQYDHIGAESKVWMIASKDKNGNPIKEVYKSINTDMSGGVQGLLDRIALHNYLFPSTKIEVKDFGTNKNGNFRVGVIQPLIIAERAATKQEIKNYMEGLGFEQEGVSGLDYRKDNIIVRDLHEDNVVADKDGNIYFIDPQILVKSQKGLGDGSVASIQNAKNETAEQPIPEGTTESVEGNEQVAPTEEGRPPETITVEAEGATGEGQPPISEPPKGSRIHVQRPATELSHRGLQNVANEFSLDDVKKRDRKTDIQLRKDAENTINSWIEKGEYGKKVEGLVKEAETTGKLSDEERVILEQHLANLSDELRSLPKGSSEFDTKLAEIKRLKEAGERARSEAGAALRIPTFRSRPKDLADYYVAEMEAAGVDKLTDQQKQTVEKEFNDITEAEKKWQQKVAALEEENAKLRAEQAVKQTASKSTKGQKKDFKAERKQIVDDIKEKLRKARGESQATVVPYLKELIAISPDVAKLMKSYVEQGITELTDLVKQIHGDLKDGIPDITETDVVDIIAGKYNEGKTQTELAAKLRELRKEAAILSDLERLDKIDPKNDKAAIELNRRKKKLKDQLGKKADTEQKTKIRDEIAEIEERLKRKDYDYERVVDKPKLDAEAKALRDKLLKLKEKRTIRLMELDYEKRPKAEKAFRFAGQIASIPRVLKSSFDVSMPFRQGIWGLSRQLLTLPIGSNKDFHVQRSVIDQFKKMYQAVGHKDNYLRAMADIKDNPRYEIAEKAGLNLSDPNSELQEAREEMYGPNIISKYIPFFGKPVTVKKGVDGKETKIGGLTEISERSASMFVNQMKWDVFNEIVDLMESNGKTIENSLEDYKQAANYANKVVGRGVLGKKVENLGYVTSRLFFSLRLMASRLQLLTDVVNPYFYHKAPKEVREAYWKDYIKFVSLAGTALLLAKAAGGDVEDDPTSSDAGKVRVGKSRYDILGGFGQYGVFGARMVTGKTTSATTGDTRELGSERGQKSRAELLLSFLRSKSSPEAGFAWNVLQGKNVIGQPTTLGKETKELFTPLMYQDIQNAFKDQSVAGAILTTLLIAHGVGYGSYDAPPENKRPERPERPKSNIERPESPDRPERP